MQWKNGIRIADVGDIVNIVDANSSVYGYSPTVVFINEYPLLGEVWYLCQFPPGVLEDSEDGTMWFRSTKVAVVA